MNLNLGDYLVAIIHGFAIYGAIDAVPGMAWYNWILPIIFLLFTVFYFSAKLGYYDDSDVKEWGDPDQKL